MIHTIASEYEPGAKPAKEYEALFTRSLQMWLRPFSEEINQQNGKLVMIFAKDGSSRFRLENVNELLKEKIASRFPGFVAP